MTYPVRRGSAAERRGAEPERSGEGSVSPADRLLITGKIQVHGCVQRFRCTKLGWCQGGLPNPICRLHTIATCPPALVHIGNIISVWTIGKGNRRRSERRRVATPLGRARGARSPTPFPYIVRRGAFC